MCFTALRAYTRIALPGMNPKSDGGLGRGLVAILVLRIYQAMATLDYFMPELVPQGEQHHGGKSHDIKINVVHTRRSCFLWHLGDQRPKDITAWTLIVVSVQRALGW